MKSDGSFFSICKPYIAMISLQFGYAGMNIITKISLNGGMSHYVLVVYRHAIATAVIAPFAFFFERPVIDQNFYYAGLKLTSPTFSCAMSNMLPAMTFVMAIIFRMEKVNIKKVIYQAKVVGTLITVGGAMLMTLYKGPLVEMAWTAHRRAIGGGGGGGKDTSDRDWFIGCILLIIATLAWASLFILQKAALKTYSNHQLSLTSMVCFMGTLQAVAGIVTSSISYYVQGLVMKSKGPVFATAFSPLMMIIVAVMGSFILAEKIYLGGVIGSAIIVVGLYSVLWGKYKEDQEQKNTLIIQEIPEIVKDNNNNNNNGIVGEEKAAVAIDLPIFTSPVKPTQQV
ncbi:hypothetical protein SASPL_113543 [Salvia splendens]|uniref:WAT1-related protein n=1 Tax=Salvia splendens TaxID=180675 RepID=A0A8X8Y3V7_SALSN|nr:hypothetical protein SASPL_113543 [Salvia splendens]